MTRPPQSDIHYSPPLPRHLPPVPAGQSKVHKYVALVSYSCVGILSVYNVFFADYGEKEHVFSPARRWLDRQKAAFWTLSPTEQAIAGQARQQQADLSHETPRPT